MDNQRLSKDESMRLIPMDAQFDAGVLNSWEHPTTNRFHNYTDKDYPCAAEVESDLLTYQGTLRSGSSSVYHFKVMGAENGTLVAKVHMGQLLSSQPAVWLCVEMMDIAGMREKAGTVIDLALRFAFVDLALHRVCVNIPSFEEMEIALYEEAGFLRETQRRQAVCHEGRFYDDLLYGILRSEWLKLQQEVDE